LKGEPKEKQYSITESRGNFTSAEERQIEGLIQKSLSDSPVKFEVTIPQVRERLKLLVGEHKLNGHLSILLVARDKAGKIIGISNGLAHPNVSEVIPMLGPGKYYKLCNTFIHPDHWRKGISTEMTRLRLEHARQTGCNLVYSDTLENNLPRRNQFEKEGFTLYPHKLWLASDIEKSFIRYGKRL
jgi:GNAT superfamily N-acetyltransferase